MTKLITDQDVIVVSILPSLQIVVVGGTISMSVDASTKGADVELQSSEGVWSSGTRQNDVDDVCDLSNAQTYVHVGSRALIKGSRVHK